MKSLCEITGLTRKTILYYEEQGFLSPGKTRSNGRDYRDDSDAKKLVGVSTLRKCGFSIEEIKRIEKLMRAIKRIRANMRCTSQGSRVPHINSDCSIMQV